MIFLGNFWIRSFFFLIIYPFFYLSNIKPEKYMLHQASEILTTALLVFPRWFCITYVIANYDNFANDYKSSIGTENLLENFILLQLCITMRIYILLIYYVLFIGLIAKFHHCAWWMINLCWPISSKHQTKNRYVYLLLFNS